MSVSVTINRNDFPRIAANFLPAVREITQLHVLKVVEVADPLTPVDTGDLKNNKTITSDSVTWNQHYAGYQNFGTVHVPPTLFASRAADVVGPQWQQALSQIEGRL